VTRSTNRSTPEAPAPDHSATVRNRILGGMIVADTLARRQVVFTGTAAPLSIQFEVDDTSELRPARRPVSRQAVEQPS
jgi:hypothetical protein